MKKRSAFTLVELVLSIFLLGLIVSFLYSAVSNLQKTNSIFASNAKTLTQRDQIIELLYDDIFQANPKDFKITKIENSMVSMQTKNSLYDMEKPYVTWLVAKEKSTLLRFESTKEFKSINSNNNYYYHITKVSENCETFRVYQSKNKENMLINIKIKDQDPIVYEFYKPMNKRAAKKNKTKSSSPNNQDNNESQEESPENNDDNVS